MLDSTNRNPYRLQIDNQALIASSLKEQAMGVFDMSPRNGISQRTVKKFLESTDADSITCNLNTPASLIELVSELILYLYT